MAPEYAFGGAEHQRALLEEEGVVFKNDGRVEMEKCGWQWNDKPQSK
jgi:methylated-DNA-protein-cysteine methyltransferase-like protein